MKRVLVLVMAICLMFTVSVFAKKASVKINVGAKSVYSGFGVGFFSGSENVLSIKKFLDKDNAFQVGLGYDYWGGGLSVSADYLFNMFDIIEMDPGDIIVYWGLGVQAGFDYYYYGFGSFGFNAGLRIPLGISYVFDKLPVDITLQVVPGVGFIHGGIGIWPTGGLGARYYF